MADQNEVLDELFDDTSTTRRMWIDEQSPEIRSFLEAVARRAIADGRRPTYPRIGRVLKEHFGVSPAHTTIARTMERLDDELRAAGETGE